MERLYLCVDPLPKKVLHLMLLFIYHVKLQSLIWNRIITKLINRPYLMLPYNKNQTLPAVVCFALNHKHDLVLSVIVSCFSCRAYFTYPEYQVYGVEFNDTYMSQISSYNSRLINKLQAWKCETGGWKQEVESCCVV